MSPGAASWARSVTPLTPTAGAGVPSTVTACTRAARTGRAIRGVLRGRSALVTPVTSSNAVGSSRPRRPPPASHPTQAFVSQVACSVSGGPGSGESGTFSRCISQAAMLWNNGAAECPGEPSALRTGAFIMIPIT